MRSRANIVICVVLYTNFFGVNAMSKEPAVEIQLGESGASFSKRNAASLKIDRQPAGLNFYQIRFQGDRKGRAVVKFDERKFSIENVLSVTGTEDLDFREEGLLLFEINSALTESDLIAHDEARIKFFSILQNIVRAGWSTTIPLSMARLRGREMTRYLLTSKRRTTLDPSYVPTLEEWMQMRSLTSWKFYSRHMYLTVSFTREHT